MVIAVDAYRIAYIALPKAGCSSVKEALARVDPGVTLPPEAEVDVNTWHALYPTTRYAEEDWARHDGWWRFCVVRDPVKRLLSAYTDIVATRQALSHSPRLRALKDLPDDPDPDMFFLNFRRYRKLSSLVRSHVLGAHVFLGPDLTIYDRVYRTSELGLLAKDLTRRTGRRVTMPHANATEMRLTLDDLSGKAVDAIRPFLSAEYDYLKGYFRNPLGSRVHGACVPPVSRVS